MKFPKKETVKKIQKKQNKKISEPYKISHNHKDKILISL